MRRPTMLAARCPASARRRGVSLLESLISVAILFISVISINQLLDTAGQQAERVRQRSLAAQLCQSKMAEVVAGAAPLSGGSGEVEGVPGWEWTVEAEEHDVPGLWRVRVSVRRQNEDAAVSLDQFVLDPSKRGSAFDTAAPSGTDSTGQSSSGMGGSSGMSGTTQPSTGGATAPTTGGGTSRPTTGGTTAPTTGGTNRPTGGTTAPATGGTNRPPSGGSSRPGGR